MYFRGDIERIRNKILSYERAIEKLQKELIELKRGGAISWEEGKHE